MLNTPMALISMADASTNPEKSARCPASVEGMEPSSCPRMLSARSVTACATHGVLSGPAIQRITDSVLDHVVFLNTIPPKPGVKCDKIHYVSVAHIFAEAISHIYMETSVSPLFN